MTCDILDRFCIHAKHDTVSNKRFPSSMVGNEFTFWFHMLFCLASGIVHIGDQRPDSCIKTTIFDVVIYFLRGKFWQWIIFEVFILIKNRTCKLIQRIDLRFMSFYNCLENLTIPDVFFSPFPVIPFFPIAG
jgi:hypothetical protein